MTENTRYAAIDVGTNAVRLVIKELIPGREKSQWNKISYTRLPIRLGEDVFTIGQISKKKMNALVLSFKAFNNLMEAMDVEYFRACSTSAMREAANSAEVIQHISKEANINLEVLSGEEEARLIMANFNSQELSVDKYYLYIDVGGGSTEISLIYNGECILSKSLKIGTVRMLKGANVYQHWEELKDFCTHIRDNYPVAIAVGTGGNINKIFKESGTRPSEMLRLSSIKLVNNYISSFTVEDRIKKLNMKPDRADVITFAGEIFVKIMTWSGLDTMIVPKIGLSDGIVLDLFENQKTVKA